MAKENRNFFSDNKKILILLGNLLLALAVAGGAFWWFHAHDGRTAVQTTANKTAAEGTSTGTDISADASENKSTGTNKSSDASGNKSTDANKSSNASGQTFTLSMVGDVLLHAPVSASGRKRNGSYNYDELFRHIKKDIKASDTALINQEVILAGEKFGITGYPTFNGRFQVGDAIEKAGFEVVLHATNHSMDKGKKGLLSCLNHWEKHHPRMKITGMYKSRKKASQITYVKKKGIRIAILNYTYGTNGLPLPADMPYAVNLLSRSKVKADVKKAKKKADFVVVCPHWGTEYQTKPDSYQKTWCRYFLKLGVDLVIGTHPHVIQPVKWMKDKRGHKMLVYYSLGNYVNASSNRYAGVFRQFCGGMARVKLQKNAQGKVFIKEAKMIPLITHWIRGGKITTYKLSAYSAKKAKKNYLTVLDRKYSRNNLEKFFRKIVDRKFLP